MTRTATKPGKRKRALDATPWSELSTSQDPKPVEQKKLKQKDRVSQVVAKDGQGKVTKTKDKKSEVSREMKKIRKSESRRLKRQHFRNSDKVCGVGHLKHRLI